MRSTTLAAILIAGGLLGCGEGRDDDGPVDGWCAAKDLAPWARRERGVGGVVSFNEIMFHPAGAAPEWIELYNPMAIEVDVSGFRIAGSVVFEFPEGSLVPPGDHVVVGSSADAPAALGAFTGELPDDAGRLELWNNAGRLLDAVRYADDDRWPVIPRGSGASLAKRAPDRASEPAEAWTASARLGGTPGAENFAAAPGEVPVGLAFNEIAGASAGDLWLELANLGATPIDVEGYAIASARGDARVLGPATLAPDGLLSVAGAELGFEVGAGEELFLFAPGREVVVDGVRFDDVPRARRTTDRAWRYPDVTTRGATNVVVEHDAIVINEILYHAPPVDQPDGTVLDSPLEWIELYNRSAEPVDVGGYQLVDAATAELPAGLVVPPGGTIVVTHDGEDLAAAYPDLDAVVVEGLGGSLGDAGDRVVLRDACANLVDEVAYADGGRWPTIADGGGSSLELRDPAADDAAPEAWAASDETAAAAWQTISYQGVAAASSVGPDGVWQELVVGLLDAGVVLIDDLSVVVDPSGAATELVAGGTFEGGAASLRLLGNHRHGEVIDDPTSPGNHVLRLVATGPTEHMHNHLETTLVGHTITNGLTYRVSLRARWQAGSNQLNTRLYFNRLARTTTLAIGGGPGTPGAPNRAVTDDLGPTYRELRHAPAVPRPGEAVEVEVVAEDPDGVGALTLWYAVDGGTPAAVSMSERGDDRGGVRFGAEVPGGAAGSVVQFWVDAEDGRGARASFPARGAASRALWRVDDGLADDRGLHVVRVLMTPADAAWLFEPRNLMSNDLVGGTVIYDEREVTYDVGVRLKSSERGRPQANRVGFALSFPPAQPFRGVYRSALIDRSQGVGFGQRELFFFQAMNHAGSVTSQYDDLIQVIPPRADLVGPAHLQLARYGGGFLDAQFEDDGDGALFEYELIYYPTTTDSGTPTGNKLPQPDSVVGIPIADLGDDEEAYRLPFIVKNARRRDDFRGLIRFARVFGQTGAAFDAEVGDVVDVDQWLRAFAIATLSGATDNYASGAQHNAEFFVRPTDGRVLYFPHDLDFLGSAQSAVVASGDLAKLIAAPARARLYYGHLHDVITTSFNGAYMQPWSERFGALLPGQDFAAHLSYVVARADWVMNAAPDAVMTAIPAVEFQITTNGGAPLAVTTETVVLDGLGWIDVDRIERAGASAPVLTWPGASAWRATATLACGANAIELDAFDRHGQPVGGDAIIVTRAGPGCF